MKTTNKLNKLSRGEKIFNICNIIFMVTMIIVMLYPMWYVIVASLSDGTTVMKAGGKMLWIHGFNLDSYRVMMENPAILSGYRNTLIVVVGGTALNIVLTAFAGYFLSRKNVMWSRVISVGIIITMYFNGGLIPSYLTVKSLGLYNSLWALILPTAISTFNVIIMRTGFESIPDSLEESAKIDGARQSTILFRIMLPLCKSTIAVLVLYYGVGHWNEWFNAMIYLKDRNLFPLQLILREIVMFNTATDVAVDKVQLSETIQYAAIVITTLPILCAYPFLMRFFEGGVMIGAVKG